MDDEMMKTARALLENPVLDNSAYFRLESYVLKNGSRLSADPSFQKLKTLMDEIAAKHNLQPLSKLQESFGLNSCAQ